MTHLRFSPLAILALATLLTGCRHAPSGPLNMPLRWTASGEDMNIFSGASLEALRQHTLTIPLAVDAREQRDAVGMNVQDNHHLPVTTGDDVAAFVTERITEVFRAAGAKIVPTGGERVIHVKIDRFFVTEADLYEGSATLGISVTDAAGKELWHGVVDGTSKRFGRSYAADNYQETLTSVLLEALKSLSDNSGFADALK